VGTVNLWPDYLLSEGVAMSKHPYAKVLEEFAAIPAEQFSQAAPFPHIVLDGLFPDEQIHQAHDLLNALPDDYWEKTNDQGIEVKLRSKWTSEYDIPEPAREMVRFFNSGQFLRALSRLTGIPHLIADPYYTGGGFNMIKPGGYLDVHVDGNWHDAMQVHRRLNLILYLNPNWRPEWVGELNLYDDKAEKAVVSITPMANRLMIFETNDYSYHGHPEPLEAPDGEARTSIILYYYTSSPRPADQVQVERPHSALWRSSGWVDKRGERTRA
jgi:Rps23 Pro-64 3,4-dihydroxylase Tpa1-like proline 4-hydroxylase